MKKIIAVANPHMIPGGLQTVVAVVKKYLAEGAFVVLGQRILLPYWFRPRSHAAVTEAAFELASRAFKLSGVDAPSLGIGFVQGTDGPLFCKAPCIEAAAVSNASQSGAGFTYERGDTIPAEDVESVLSDILRHHLTAPVAQPA